MQLNQYPEYIRERYQNGYFSYCVTITFKRDADYAVCHPKKGHERFRSAFAAYFKKRNAEYIMFPEIDTNGNLHYHGIVMFKSSDYDLHEKSLRLVRNYCNRKFGFNKFQRIYSWFTMYEVPNISKFARGVAPVTSFERIWKYITKDHLPVLKYGFLPHFD